SCSRWTSGSWLFRRSRKALCWAISAASSSSSITSNKDCSSVFPTRISRMGRTSSSKSNSCTGHVQRAFIVTPKEKMSRKGNRNNTPYEVKKGHYLVGNCGIYKVLQFLGEGTYGKVAKCIKFGTQEMYAIKIMKNNKAGQKEVESMKLIEHLDPEENHLVQMYECFSFQNMTCIVYELLGNSLFQVMCDQPDPVHLHGIRAFARDGLKALKALKRIGLAHCDIKIDNIMVANTSYINLKLIDFGMATKTKDLSVGTEIQVTPFKSPEVILGLPLDEGVDMWAFGMVLASLYFGEYPFPSETEYETIRAMVQIHGLPEAEMIRKARFKKAFFTRDNDGWRLCTPDEYTQATRIPVEDKNHVTNLDEMIDDHKVFIDLLKCMLEINPKNRITPRQALAHDFITMKHLSGESKLWDDVLPGLVALDVLPLKRSTGATGRYCK
uniref:Protein kinase domain-containing protein n=1 Tax=Oryzias melastigma TaxID=30732 RepID=A0A3B3BDG9_ORYME